MVDVPASELANILDIARGCARYPRVRFVLVADHVELPLRGQVAADLSAGMSGTGEWLLRVVLVRLIYVLANALQEPHGMFATTPACSAKLVCCYTVLAIGRYAWVLCLVSAMNVAVYASAAHGQRMAIDWFRVTIISDSA